MFAMVFKGWSRYIANACAFSRNNPNPTFSFAYKHKSKLATSVITTFPSCKWKEYEKFLPYKIIKNLVHYYHAIH